MGNRCPECLAREYSTRFDEPKVHTCENGHEFQSPMNIIGVVYRHIRRNLGVTGREIADAYDWGVYPQKELEKLVDAGKIERTEETPHRFTARGRAESFYGAFREREGSE